MKSFLRQGTTVLRQSGLRVKLPYDKNRVKLPYSEQYFTLFPRGHDRARVYKVEDFPELKALQENQSQGSSIGLSESTKSVSHEIPLEAKGGNSILSDLDYLLDKYPVESSDGLPLYGDSGDENDLDEDTWKEIEEEKAEEEELRRKPTTMTPDEVEAAMNEAILEWKQEWRATRFLGVQRKAYRHWMNAARNKSRQEEIQYFKYRKNQLLHSLELTVYQHQEYEYYGQVMLQDTPPERPNKDALRAIRTSKQHDLEEGEELLESESETFTEDGLSFVDDSSDEGSIHHVPEIEDWNPIIPSTTRQPAADIRESPLPDVNANDADVETESDDVIVTSARRKVNRIKTEVTHTLNTKRLISLKRKPPKPQQSASDTSDLDGSPRLPNSRYRNKGRSVVAPVDLTFSSQSGPERSANDTSTDFSVHTPELNPTRVEDAKKKSKKHNLVVNSTDSESENMPSQDDTSLPGVYDFQGLRRVSWSDIDPIDKRRALAKAVYDLEPDAASKLALFLDSMEDSSQVQETVIVNGLLALDGDDAIIPGIKTKYQLSAQSLVLLYLTYIFGQNAFEEFELSEAHRDQAFADKDSALIPFYSLLRRIIRTYFRNQTGLQTQTKGKKRKRDQDSFSIPETEDDADEQMTDMILTDPFEEAQPPSHKKRKRKVEESQEAKTQQYTDKVRIQEQEERRKNMADKLALIQADGSAVRIVNTEEPPVELHRHIAQRVKPHQLSGIQFMWREIVEDPRHQGCILAHTMGLGKTMQVISLLVTISLCNQSSDQSIRDHIPDHLRTSKTLILSPASLLNNWEDELLMWTPVPAVLGDIYKADSLKKQDNIHAIRAWSKQGGVLLIGYERFRQSITNSINAKAKGPVPVDLEKILLEEPTLVIADEAHSLKNAKSKISQIAKRLKTTSRIALSGSPLNNHLEEYHTMVDWIAPGYLGDMVQFRSKYSEPIMEGLYSDSSAYEKRLSLRKLHVLKKDLDPKINRADISAIEKDMPSKTEYFITIPLTDLQKQAYDIYVGHMLQSFKLMVGTVKGRNARIWDWLAMLSWLCHHPAGFVAKMKEREKKSNEDQLMRNQANDASEPSDSTDETSPLVEVKENVAPDVTGPLRVAMRQALQILPDASDRKAFYDPALSYRTLAVKRILEKAIEAGDKTLIFSHSIPTLNYLEQMLKGMKASFCRIDGETKVSDRQAFTKEFNQRDDFQVFLISMRAGGLGLNLQGANRVIIFDFSFNPTWEQQAIGRAYRLNQKRPVFVYRFQAGGTFEDKLFNTSVFKTQLFGRVVDKKNPRRHASKAAHTEYLFPVRDIPQVDFGESLGRDPKVLDAIIHELDFVRSIVLTETFQKEDDEQLNDEDQKVAEEEYNDQRLQREDPVAWQAKQDALLAEQQIQQPRFLNSDPMASSNPAVISTAPTLRQKTGTIANKSRFSRSNAVAFPFGRAHLDAPQRPQPVQMAFHTPGSYDDTFQAFAQERDHPRRAASTEPDVPMT
ncbi:Helicase conserved domain-containing protein [Cladophialophora immunda]|nr:Helicase conserved domain-containing protein [Cladophialophora immunda]